MAWSLFGSSTRPHREYRPVRQSSGDDFEDKDTSAHSRRNSTIGSRPLPRSDSPDGGMGDDPELGISSCFGYVKTMASRRRRPRLVFTTLAAFVAFTFVLMCSFSTFNIILPDNWTSRRVADLSDNRPDKASDEALDHMFQVADNATLTLQDTSHVLLPVQSPLPEAIRLLPEVDTRMPLNHLKQFYVTGTLPGYINHAPSRFDLVYLFVNSTSPYLAKALEAKSQMEGIELKGHTRHWRDNGELRGAVRSGALAFGERVRNIHLVSAAFDFDANEYGLVTPDNRSTGAWRMGQIPEWLDWENKGNLRWHFHPEIFRLPRDTNGALAASIKSKKEDVWQKVALPTFNSFAIESRVAYLHGLGENFVMSNDDMFFVRGHATSDFHHPVFGVVQRLAIGLLVPPELPDHLKNDAGEWGGLQHAAVIIAERFPKRKRPYGSHIPRGLTRAVAHEAAIMFAEPLSLAATRGFRESKRGLADVSTTWMVAHVGMERWREGLLWSWAVARLGGTSGVWGAEARSEIRHALGVPLEGPVGDIVHVRQGPRSTKDDVEKIMRHFGWELPKNTAMHFTSFDGHLPYDSAKAEGKESTECLFDINACLPPGFFDSNADISAVDMFKSLTFDKYYCGDCLITALVTASGERGLSAFLPAEDAVFYPQARPAPRRDENGEEILEARWERTEPFLPLTPTWQEANFSLAHNVRAGQDVWAGAPAAEDGSVNLQNYCVKLLSRYAYVYGSTPSKFSMVHNVLQFAKAVKEVAQNPRLALLCINDDQPDDTKGYVRLSMQRWMEKLFGGESPYVRWERKRWKWDGSGEEELVIEEDSGKP